ncbi:MFS transporter [Micrococcus terreus]|uniref:MFS transporter n=1 Tax=Micrococcus terreus TaxID=574650 RepID=UPI0021A603D1|nr:MFS transporter [Micrococcus terreus]MCT2088953.1 MFS transporter [Micrococcus terreus]
MPPSSPQRATASGGSRAWIIVVVAGVASAMHIWKLPGALDFIRADLGLSLVDSGVLLGIVQVGSMLLGLAASLFSEIWGLRRTLVVGMVLLAVGSLAGAFATETWFLMLTRMLEGVGFLMAGVVAPALIRRVAHPASANIAMGWWAGFQGMATFLAVLASTLLLTSVSWNTWWIIMAVITAITVPLILAGVPADPDTGPPQVGAAVVRIRRTVATLTPWIAGIVFACYTLQWGAVIGFLPTIFREAGVGGLWPGVVTAVVGGMNAVGNILTGRLHQRGVSALPLLLIGLITMAVTTVVTFAPDWTSVPGGLVVQIVAVTLFSGVGALIPATLTRIAVDVAPEDGSPAAVMGLMQQIYNAANLVGPIILAAIATASGGWRLSWTMTLAASLIGIALAVRFLGARRLGLDFRHTD